MASNTTKNVQLSLDVPVVVKLLDSWEEVISLLIEQLVVLIVPNQSMLLEDARNINIKMLLFRVKREAFSYLLAKPYFLIGIQIEALAFRVISQLL